MGNSVLRWFLSFIGVQLLCGIVWFLGPLAPELEETLPRIAVIAVLAVLWAIGNLVLDVRRLSRERTLTEGVAGGKAEAAEAAALQEKLSTAMALLKQRGKGALYEQPWYVIIGPPGAGKTTALLNAGLEFPLAEQIGRGALAGVGGTRLCEWWFTEDAVLIDTAGRYTTQDSDAAVDKAGWEKFLDLLKRTRPTLPLNGVIVAIALTDLVADGADRLAHARAIRRRIAELESKLGLRIPVYALLTKADLLAGFTEFFGDLDRDGRAQVWGVTLPWRPGATADALATVTAGFNRLAATLEQRMFARLQSEPSSERRALVTNFPGQFATVGGPVAEFLGEAFAPAPNEKAPLLRGVYLTSATQEGAPIDRLTAAMARAFGLDARQAPRLRPEEGRTFFLTRLLRDVVFREAMLATARPGARRRATALRLAGFAACVLLVLAGAALLFRERQGEAASLDAEQSALAAYEQAAGALPLDPVADADLPSLVPLLDRARALPYGYDEQQSATAGPLGLGQEGKLAAASRAIYRHGLEFALFPRLVWRLETQMRGNLTDADFEYEATRIYLMLGGAGPLDRDLVRDWMSIDWEQAYPGPEQAPLRASLRRHLDALLDNPLPSVQLDGDLVAAARATFNRVSLAQRIYSRIKPSAAAARLPPWRPSDALGAAGVKVFIRNSGRPMEDGVPGFLTAAGFRQVLLPSLETALQDVSAESWVTGAKSDLGPDSPAARTAKQEVIRLYTNDFIATWDAMLADLDIAPLRSLVQAAQDLFILASPASPMRALLASVSEQTTLAAAASAPSAAPESAERQRILAALGRPAAAAEPATAPGHEVDDHFAGLHELMRAGTLDQVFKPLTDLQQQLAKMAASANRAGATPDPGTADPATALRVEALRQPQPLQRWLTSVAASGAALRSGGAKQQITAAFSGGGGPAALCPVVVNNKYPFTPGAAQEAGLDEFGKLFAPGGALDAFFNTQLKPYVDTSARPWKLQQVEGQSAPIAPADLLQFQRAAAIRDLYFAGGGTAPKLHFDLTPASKDPGATSVTLDLGSASLTYSGGPPRPLQITWPPPKPGPVKLSWDPPAPGSPGLQEQGAWALFRLFARGRIAPAGGDRATISFRDGERSASFDLRTAPNPFASTLLQEFRCPSLQ